MKQRTENESLLADVLGTETEAGFSEAVLAETLRGARRRRHVRQLCTYGGALTVVLAVAFLSAHFFRLSLPQELAAMPPPTSYQLVVSQPLSPTHMISSKPLAIDQQIVSVATAQLVSTVAGGFGEIDDDELIALAAPRVVALVRRGPHEAELLFVSSPTANSDSHPN